MEAELGVFDRVMNEDRVSLAVTGLSRAGKTVFITSLIHNLLALPRRNTLPQLSALLTKGGKNRLRDVQVLPPGVSALPYFDYPAKLRDLASENPLWPPRTEDLAKISLALELDRSSFVGSKMLGRRRVTLDILDYPGEWLLDMSMLEQGYSVWSLRTLKLLRTAPRRTSCAEFLDFMAGLRPEDKAEETLLKRGHDLYREALHRCRREHGLRYLQPGRFICPGPFSDAPYMWFFPMDGAPEKPASDTAGWLLQARFERYKKHVRESFFGTHFAAFDRQIVLVDVLGALCAGRAAFEDTARSLSEIAAGLDYGAPAWIMKAFGSRGIERVTFVATKADHVPGLKRDNLRLLLKEVAENSRDNGNGTASKRNGDVQISHQVAASILSTTDDVSTVQGRPMEVVKGIVLGEAAARPFFVGDVPASGPPESYWHHAFFELPTFKPPPIDPLGQHGIAHLDLDAVLADAIGDLL